MFLNRHRLDLWNLSAPIGGVDPATTSWVAAVVAAGGTVSAARQILINNLIVGLRADGLWTKLDRLWLHAGENTQSALVDLVADSLATVNGAPTFTADQGYTFNGLNTWLDTNYKPIANAVSYALNSAHFSSYVRSVAGIVGPECLCGAFDGATFSVLALNFIAAPVNFSLINNASSFNTGVIVAGMMISSRTAVNLTTIFNNGSSSITDANASTSVPNINVFIGARNDTGVAQQISNRQIASTSIGGALSSTDAANLTTRINTYMTAIGANVF